MGTFSAYQIAPAASLSWRDESLISNLKLNSDLPIPKPRSGQVLVKIEAAALNARDLMVIAHDSIYPIETISNLSPCCDGAGIIAEVGERSVWAIGDKVVLIPQLGWKETKWPVLTELKGRGAGDVEGTLREYIIVEDDQLIKAPSHLSSIETAALPTAGGTAMSALFFGPTPVTAGMTVLTQGTGGVSCFAIQLAAAAGATVIATSSSKEKLKLAKQLGATHLINYSSTPDWSTRVLELTSGHGVDHVVDVAGAGTIEQSIKATRQGGLISLIGNLSGHKKVDIVEPLFFGAKSMRGIFGANIEVIEALMQFVYEKSMTPFVGKELGWGEARKAFQLLGQREVVGKIVVRVGGS